jgi:DNA modification methylase
MGGKRAALMATDPPYAVGYDGTNHPEHRTGRPAMAGDQPSRNKDWAGLYQEASGDGSLDRAFMALALESVLTPRVAIYQWHAERRLDAVMATWRELGLNVHQLVYWLKPPVLTFSHFMGCVEPCLYGWREGHGPELEPPRDARQVWEYGRAVLPGERTVHPTQKPVELFARPIEWHTRPSEICYEPFGGSGTQIIAAEQLGRACYCMEISPEFCDVILARWESCTGREAVRLE